MKAQAMYGMAGQAKRCGGKRGKRPRFVAALLGALLCVTLLSASTGQALADQGGDPRQAVNLWTMLSAQSRKMVAQSQRFASDVRLLYQVAHLEPLASATPSAAPATAETSCKMISSRATSGSFRPANKTRS